MSAKTATVTDVEGRECGQGSARKGMNEPTWEEGQVSGSEYDTNAAWKESGLNHGP